MIGHVDYLRLSMGWWSSPEFVPPASVGIVCAKNVETRKPSACNESTRKPAVFDETIRFPNTFDQELTNC